MSVQEELLRRQSPAIATRSRVRSKTPHLTIASMPAAPVSATAPEAEYERRLEIRRGEAGLWRRRAAIVSNLRLIWFVAGGVCAWWVLGPSAAHPAWLLGAIAGFVALIVVHDRYLRKSQRAERAVRLYESGCERLAGRWMGQGEAGERFLDADHLYAADLDLFGQGSLFERLCVARTRVGEATLAEWLSVPASTGEVGARQSAVAELAPDLDLREEFALVGSDVAAGMHPDALRAWGEGTVEGDLRPLRITAACSAGFTLVAIGGWLGGILGPIPLEVMLVLQSVFAIVVRGRVRRAIREAEEPCRDLVLMAELLARLEAPTFQAPLLQEIQSRLARSGTPAAQRIAQLRRQLEMLDARRNQLFAPIGALFLWSTQWALAVESWRAVSGPDLGSWIDAIGKAEALLCLAGFRYENPQYTFPEIASGAPRFDGQGLGHPLLQAQRCVTNDVALGGEMQLMVVSGSNMSGKSTLLRTIGINTVLALAGAPVSARSLSLTPFAIGASIRILDSLLDGSSQFYAEIRRLKQIMELTGGELPVLFVIDEILHGTNSHDRGIGAEAVVRGLVERGAVGLVTTHDLALARVADALAPRAVNVHFQDHLEDGAIAFDYRLRPGVVEKSNALELMRAVGLEV
jgi:hypothetical protein